MEEKQFNSFTNGLIENFEKLIVKTYEQITRLDDGEEIIESEVLNAYNSALPLVNHFRNQSYLFPNDLAHSLGTFFSLQVTCTSLEGLLGTDNEGKIEDHVLVLICHVCNYHTCHKKQQEKVHP